MLLPIRIVGPSTPLSRVGQRLPMGRHELRQAVGPLPIFSHVGIIEDRDATNRC